MVRFEKEPSWIAEHIRFDQQHARDIGYSDSHDTSLRSLVRDSFRRLIKISRPDKPIHQFDAGLSGSTMSGGSGYNRPSRSINGFAPGVLSWVGSLTGWSHVRVRMPASVSNVRIVDRQASSVNSVPSRRSSTRSLGSVGGASVWMSAQQRLKIVVRSSDGTLSVVRSAVQSADTNRTNCKSGSPGFWISNDGMAEHYRWRPARSQRAKSSSPRKCHD